MSGSNRVNVLATIGWLILAANESSTAPSGVSSSHSASQRTTQAESRQSITKGNAAPELPKFTGNDEGCTKGKDKRTSDLCAQWKAADSAFDAARASERQVLIGWFGLLLGSITMFAAIAAALYAKRAAIATETTVEIARQAADGAGQALTIAGRSADAAVKLADQAETTAQQQLRPYLSIHGAIFYVEFIDLDGPQLVISLDNHGQTPATIFKQNIDCCWYLGGEFSEEFFRVRNTVETDIFPKTIVRIPIRMPETISHGDDHGIIFLNGRIDYRDVFGRPHILPFQFQTLNKMSYSDIDDGQSLAVRPFSFTAKQGGD